MNQKNLKQIFQQYIDKFEYLNRYWWTGISMANTKDLQWSFNNLPQLNF